MERKDKYPDVFSEVLRDAANREPSRMDTVYGLPVPDFTAMNDVYNGPDPEELLINEEDPSDHPSEKDADSGKGGILKRLLGK